MKRRAILVLALLTLAAAPVRAADPAAGPELSDFLIEGRIEGENIVFTLTCEADVGRGAFSLPLVEGDVTCMDATLPRGVLLRRDEARYRLEFPPSAFLSFGAKGRYPVRFSFAARAVKEGDWRRASFRVPLTVIRRVAIVCDRDDLEIAFPGALNVEKAPGSRDGKTLVTAQLGATDVFEVRWKPEVRRLEAELAVACEANTIAVASVGALRLDSLFTYRIVQGVLRQIELAVPDSVNVTEVTGPDLQDWRMDGPAGAAGRTLTVTLSRPCETVYRLQVKAEMALPDFPAAFDLPVLTPRGVIRTSGFLMTGTDSAIKLLVARTGGLTQVDQASFPQVHPDKAGNPPRAMPSRSPFAYQYANMPYTLTMQADDIVPEYSTDDRMVLSAEDSDLVVQLSTEVEFRDAPARELILETSPDWTVAAVAGATVADYDVRDTGTVRQIHVFFGSAVLGRTLIELRLERTLPAGAAEFAPPPFRVTGARSQRGFIALTAEKGLRLKASGLTALREVHASSLPLRVPDVQHAFRYRDAQWSATVTVERTEPVVHAEIFNLSSIGEGVLYGSASITYQVSGAPTRTFRIRVPPEAQNLEFTGRDVRGWTREGDVWTVTLQEKVIGSYTLLATYDQRMAYDEAEWLAGGISTVGTESEVGYLVLASDALLHLTETAVDAGMIRIDREEVPKSYLLLVNDPLITAYKYVRTPHTVTLRMARFATESLLDQIVDHTTLSTTVSRDGESVTTATYLIKNASQQYLSIVLPDGASLWSARQEDEGGAMAEIAPLRGEQSTLIPVGRRRDPNQPIRLELTYAQNAGAMSVLGRALELSSPALQGTHATFARWTVTAPDKHAALALTGGSMPPEPAPAPSGLWTVATNLGRVWLGTLVNFPGVAIFFVGFVVAAGLVVAATARRRRVGVMSAVAAALLVVTLVLAGLVTASARPRGAHFEDIDFAAGTRTVSFVRPLSLADGKPLTIRADLAPRWLGAGASIPAAAAAAVAAIILCGAGLALGRRRGLLALGLTAFAWAVAALAAGRVALTFALAIAGPAMAAVWILRLIWRRGLRRRSPDATAEHAPAPEPFVAVPPEPAPSAGIEGASTPIALLALFALGAACLLGLAGPARGEAPAPGQQAEAASQAIAPEVAAAPRPANAGMPPLQPPTMEAVTLTVVGPAMNRDAERSVRVTTEMEFELTAPSAFPVLEAHSVVTGMRLGSPALRLEAGPDGYRLAAARAGRYRVSIEHLVPAAEAEGLWSVSLPLPPSIRNRVVLRIPEKELDVRAPEAVYLSAAETPEGTEAAAAFGPGQRALLTWRARARKTGLEKVAFFCEVNTLAAFEPGVVDLTSLIRFQIAQGELRSVAIDVPESMSVTSVSAPGLGTWRFDPESRLLEALLEKPVSGDFTLTVVAQIPREGLPYTARIAALSIRDADRQRGSIALAVPETVQLSPGESAGLSAMNIADFPADVAAARQGARGGDRLASKRAFRYQQPQAAVTVTAEKVLPEIRIQETSTLSIADERVVLSSQLALTVAKAGIFSLRLGIPADFDIESLSGEDVSHWDDVKEDAGRAVLVHFQKQVLGERRLNLVVARMEKGIEQAVPVPRIDVAEARKHTGTLVVSGERGVRLATVRRDGVSELNPRDMGIREPGVLAFRILRPGWDVGLATEVLAPTIKPEVLHRIDLAEGMIHGTAFIRYSIESAGTKTFRIQAPRPGISLTITGRNIAKVYEADREKGIWQIDLNSKVEQTMLLRAAYQMPYDPAAGTVDIGALTTLDTEGQKGYLVVMSSGRIQVKPEGDLAGLKAEEARTIPPEFEAGDLSDAILCYRTVLPAYALRLAVRRHGAAETLPAEVLNMEMTSVLSADGQMLSRVQLAMRVGDLRFLRVTLPGDQDQLWSVFVNGKVARPARDGRAYRIPLDESLSAQSTAVDLVYAGPAARALGAFRACRGPGFNLPLRNLTWTLFVRPGSLYYGFGGTFELAGQSQARGLSLQSYTVDNKRQMETDLQRARVVMAEGEKFAQEGQQLQAKQAFEAAMNLSVAQQDFNEDARIQYQNLVRQQAFVGLVQRRSEMQSARNVIDEDQVQQMEDFKGGNFTPDYARRIEQSLPAEENTVLQKVAQKIIDQQEAAAVVSQAIRITVPEEGRCLVFRRPLQISPDADMTVSFRTLGTGLVRAVKAVAAAAALVLFFRLLLGRRGPSAA